MQPTEKKITDWKKNIFVFKINSVFNWFQVAIGVWVLIWTHYLNFTQIALIYGFSLLWGVLLDLPTGALADMVGRKKTVLIGRFLNIIANIVYFYSNNFALFLIGNILYQSNWTFESGAHSALLYDSLKENGQDKEHYKKTESNTFLYNTLGMVVASILGGLLFRYDIHLPYLACVVAAIVSFVLTLFFDEPHIAHEKFTVKSYLKQNFEGFRYIFVSDTMRAISFFSITISFITYSALWYIYEPRLAQGNFSAQMLSILVAGTYLIRAFGTKLVSSVEKKIKHFQIPLFLTISQIVGSFLSFLPGKVGAITSVYSRKFNDGFRYPILVTLQNEEIESKYRATALSAISVSTNLLVGLAGPLIGIMNDTLKPSITLGIFGFVGIILVLPFASHLGTIIKNQYEHS